MIPHDILTLYSAKMVEYAIAVVFLLLFIPFWRFVQGPSRALAPATARDASRATTLADWFSVPADRLFHRGHAWAQPADSGLVTVGLDDFAANLVGPLARISLPAVGAPVGQGERGWRMTAGDGRSVEMLSPVDGTVVEINQAVADDPAVAMADPYHHGWLLKVRPSRMVANRTNLLSGATARQWIRSVAAGLQAQLAPGLGALAQDGGVPVAGMARSLDAEHWDAVARTYLLSADEEHTHA
jgi:glycine cleavage system H lipoate-binding protein